MPFAVAGRVRPPAGRDVPRVLACGLTGMAAYQLLLNAGERSVPAGTASLLVAGAPVPPGAGPAPVASRNLGRRRPVGEAEGCSA